MAFDRIKARRAKRKAAREASASEGNASATPKKPILTYPLDLREFDGREVIRFTIKDRKELEERKSIFLYCPPGLAVADGASYGNLDLGMMGGMMDRYNAAKAKGGGVADAVKGADLIGAMKVKAAEWAPGIGGKALFQMGVASNPYSVQQFTGVTNRSFSFTFKLVAESEKESVEIKSIENTFRKFLYPKLGDSPLTFKYPPYWQIQFLRGEENNTHLPFINLCYLQSMTATYNQGSNAFHGDGSPTEVDISLTFTESKNLTRDDLYKKVDDYNDAEYTYEYTGHKAMGADESKAISDAADSATDSATGP